MSNINLRLYADQVYGLSSSFLNDYLSPSIEKEKFINMFKNGLVKYDKINTKKEIIIHSTLSINNLEINSLEINVPDENSHVIINIKGLKSILNLSEMNENNLEEIIISEKKELKEKFIKYLFNKITKKSDSSSFLEGLIENLIKKIINGIKISIKDIEIVIKFEKFKFFLNINNLDLVIENKELNINLNEFSISYNNDITKDELINIINKSDFNIKLIIKDNENENNEIKENREIIETPCQLKVHSNNLKINLKNYVIKSIFDIVNLFRDIEYNKFYHRFKRLIYFHRPKRDNKNKNYILLWLYAIKTIIKLRKFVLFDNLDIFELLNSTQQKLEKKENKENYVVINNLNILNSTKSTVEKKILDSKDSIANKFFSFFSSKSEENNLTEEEKEMLEYAYKKDNLEKYIINGKYDDNDENEKELFKKLKIFIKNFEINLDIEKISIKFIDLNKDDNDILLNNILFYLKYTDNKINFHINVQDIGKKESQSFCKEIINLDKNNKDNNNLLMIKYNENNLDFMIWKKVELPEDILYSIICYTNSIVQNIIQFNKRSIFHKIKKRYIKQSNVNKKININIPYLPSFTLLTNDNNKIEFEISDYSWTNKLISFKFRISDSYKLIINNYQFSILINESQQKYIINLENPLNINMDKTILENLLINFKNINNRIFTEINFRNSNILFDFQFKKKINSLKNIKLFNNNINIKINDFNLIIKDKENETFIKFKDINFEYENRILSFCAKEIFLNFDLLSILPTIKEINNIKLYTQQIQYKREYNFLNIFNELIKEIKIDINHVKGFLYLEHKNYYINLISNEIKVSNNSNNKQIINISLNDFNMNWVYIPDKIKIIDSKNINLDIRINPLSHLAFKFNMESPVLSIIFLVFNFQKIKKCLNYFFKLKMIYEIKITNIKTEIFESYLENPEDKDRSELSINLTNYKKINDDKNIDLINLEQSGLNYNLDSYTNLILGLKGKKLKFFGSQRDFSFLFFNILRPDEGKEENKKDNFIDFFTSIALEIDLYQIKVNFHLEKSYDKIFFDFYFGSLLLNLNILENNKTNFIFGLDQIQMKYYEDNIDNDLNIPITILNYEIEQEKRHLEIKKDINNKIYFNINKINLLFRYDIILSIFYYFNDISVIDLIYNFVKNNEKNKSEVHNKEEKNIDIQIILSELQLKFPIDYLNQSNCIYFYLNQFDFSYIKVFNNTIKDQSIRISLNNIKLKNHKRNIIFSKDEYLLFVLNIKDNNSLAIISNALFNSLIINLAYKDIIIFSKIILDIEKIYQNVIGKKDKNLLSNENYNDKRVGNIIHSNSTSIDENKFKYLKTIEDKTDKYLNFFKNINSIISEINIESINITLLEDNCNYYYPFLNINIYKVNINYEFNKIDGNKYPFNKFNSNYNFLVNYFNDIIKIWEPVTEDLIIKFDYIFKNENNKLIDNFTLEINKLLLNVSDMFINILLIKLNKWINQLNRHLKYLKKISKIKKINKTNNNDNYTKINNIILKYVIHNYTDLDLTINYKNQKYIINHSEKINIEYDNEKIFENEDNLWRLILIEFNGNKNNNKILLFPEEFGLKQFKINIDNLDRNIYVKTKINRYNFIEIFIFNPIIFKNNTNFTLQMQLNDGKEIQPKLIQVNPNSIVGIPLNHIISKDTNFKIELKKDSELHENTLSDLLYLKEFISNDLKLKINKDIIFNNILCLSLISKIKEDNYKEIILSNKYCIINCLPCPIFISKQKENEGDNAIKIKNNYLFNINDTSLLIEHNSIKLKIKIGDNYFHSKLSLDRNETKKLIKFSSINNKESIILPLLIKETLKTKVIIIYSEYIINNSSGIELNISSQDDKNQNYFYNVEKNIFLISSEIKKTDPCLYIKSNQNIFLTNYIKYKQIENDKLFEFSLNIEDKIKAEQYSFDLIVNKNISNLWCENDNNNFIRKIKEEIGLIVIYNIIPKYNIINFPKRNVKDNYINLIIKKNKKYYMGLNIENYEETKEIKNYYMFDNLSLNSLYTICIKDNLYNVEVRKAKKGGYKDILIFNNNLRNSQIVVENKTNYNICLKQKKYEKFKQIIPKNQTQILKIYEQTNPIFSAEIDKKIYYFNLNEIGKKQILNNIYINIENNLNSKNIVFYIQNIEEEDFSLKSKSVMNLPKISYNNFKLNLKTDKYIKINIILNHINISIIEQNAKTNSKNKKNIYDYERKERALIFIDNFQSGIQISNSNTNILPKINNIYQIKLNIKILNCDIYNLIMNNNISCLCTNISSPLINIYSEINYNYDKNRLKIFELVNKIGDIKLNIVPIFLKEIYNFINNIISNVKSDYQAIDNIFLSNDLKTINKYNIYNDYKNSPLSIIIDQIDILGIKIRFKINKEGLDTLPKLIIDFIEYLKCFPFFAIDKETKAILGQISIEGPFKDISILLDSFKSMVIRELSKEIVIKVLHPSANEIKDNINNMIGYDNKNNHKINNDEKIMRAKYKRIFFGKNQFFKKYDKNEENLKQKIKEELKIYKDVYVIDNFYANNNVIILFKDFLFYANDNGDRQKVIYKNIKNISYDKSELLIKCIDSKEEDKILEFPDKNISEKIYKFLLYFSNNN